jgi:hypothetical protein
MKFTPVILLALLSVSCGKIKMSGTPGIGGVRQLAALQISTADQQTLFRVCEALTKKSSKLKLSLPNSLVFDVVEKDCKGNTVTFNSQQVRVESSGTDFQFRRQDTNSLFMFPNVETSESGFMKEICGGATELPYSRGTEAVWVSTGGFTTTDCPNASGEQCLMVEYGTKQETGSTYLIHTIEFVRFNLVPNNGKYGYFTHRKVLAQNNCDEGENTDSQATLR